MSQYKIKAHFKLIDLIIKQSGLSDIALDQDLERDLGISGDDALELMLAIEQEFDVDFNQFKFSDYFYDEMQQMQRFFHWLTRRYKRKVITAEDLIAAIEQGKWTQ